MNITYEVALEKYSRLCTKTCKENRRGNASLLPFVRAMSSEYEFSLVFPSLTDLRTLADQDRADVLLLTNYLVRCPRVPPEFRREFDAMDM